MVQRNANANSEEPQQLSFKNPTEKEHLFQVIDVDETIDASPDIVYVKCEVIEGEEEGRSLMNRLNLDDEVKGFFATRLFLKAIGEQYKGKDFPIDTDNWIGRQFYATVVHNKGKGEGAKVYANIEEYNFDKMIEDQASSPTKQSGTAANAAITESCGCPQDTIESEKDPTRPDIDICKKCKKPVVAWDKEEE